VFFEFDDHCSSFIWFCSADIRESIGRTKIQLALRAALPSTFSGCAKLWASRQCYNGILAFCLLFDSYLYFIDFYSYWIGAFANKSGGIYYSFINKVASEYSTTGKYWLVCCWYFAIAAAFLKQLSARRWWWW